jgi:hypothetical protein
MKLTRREKHQERGTVSPFGQGPFGPLNQLSRIRNEINRIFEDPFGFASAASTFFEGWTPAMDVLKRRTTLLCGPKCPA